MRDVLVADRLDMLRFRGVMGGKKIVKPTGAAHLGQFPWMMALEVYHPIERKWIPYCGGTLIRPNVLLSAAHCTDFPKEYIRVVAGAVDLADTGNARYVGVSRILSHPQFAHETVTLSDGRKIIGAVNDFALYFLRETLDTPTVSLLADASKADSVARGIGRSMGWGRTDNGEASPVLLYVDVPIVSDEDCGKSYSTIGHSMLCAGYKAGGGDACDGDSGGPLLVAAPGGDLQQLGVVSFGEGCGLPGYYNIYAWISAGIQWIDAQAGN